MTIWGDAALLAAEKGAPPIVGGWLLPLPP
jgi:hypothetical protein